MIRWKAYSEKFAAEYAALSGALLEHGSAECGPYLRGTGKPGQAPWLLDWAVIFEDNNYVRVKESFRRCGYPDSGLGERQHFSYHYGPAHAGRDAQGFPETRGAPSAMIRIDEDRQGPHLHLDNENHIPQDRVDGYVIRDANMVDFLQAVIAHRKSGQSLVDLLHLTVRGDHA